MVSKLNKCLLVNTFSIDWLIPKSTNRIDKLVGIIEAGRASNRGKRCEEATTWNLESAKLFMSDCKATIKSP